jgi:putative endopeptidase
VSQCRTAKKGKIVVERRPAIEYDHTVRKTTFAVVAASLIACSGKGSGSSTTPKDPNARAAYGTFGFDEVGMNRSVAAGDDFYEFANGAWAKKTEIPADRSNFGMFAVLDDLSQQRTREIVEAAAQIAGNKVGDLYTSFLDEKTVEAKGMTPLVPWLDKIKAIKTPQDLARVMVELNRAGLANVPFAGYIGQDDKQPDQYIAQLAQSGLGLPDRDYYLGDDEQLKGVRAAYVAYLEQLFTLTQQTDGKSRVAAVVAFETELAKGQWTRIESRDSTKTYNKWQRADFEKNAPGFEWGAFFAAAGTEKQPAFLVAQPSAFTAMAKLIAATPIAVLRDYLMLHTIDGAAPALSQAFVDASFNFHDKTLSGTPENEPRWKRAVGLVTGVMGEAVGEQYVAKYFPPAAKAEADKLVKNVIAAMDQRLANLAWMAPETRTAARAKLAAFTAKIGFPDKWRDYSSLSIVRDDLFGNTLRASEFEWRRQLAHLGQPIDRGEWGMTPMTINAYANPVLNEIVFPAAILQPPFFDPNADAAVNYGGIGAVIGHEISHHFDDQGRKYDKTGALKDWWTEQDIKQFEALTAQLVKQYDGYEALPGKKVQGSLTLGENIADLAGMTVAYDAYRMSLGGKEAPVINGFTGDQRFYLGWAQVWRRNYRPENLAQRLMTDPHSPSIQRVWVVRNLDAWYNAFAPKATEKLALPPEQRVRIW